MKMKEDAMINGQLKLVNYEVSKTRKYKNDIEKIEHTNYLKDKGVYICKGEKSISYIIRYRREKQKL